MHESQHEGNCNTEEQRIAKAIGEHVPRASAQRRRSREKAE
jgi:hypothetical protein